MRLNTHLSLLPPPRKSGEPATSNGGAAAQPPLSAAAPSPDPLTQLVDEILDRMDETDRRLEAWIERLKSA